jgi:2-methylcitrate dehydratase PrpD
MSLQSELISYIAAARYEDLPERVVEATKKSILDTLAVVIAGSTDEYIPELARLAKEWGGREECTIPLYQLKVPAPTAAFVNCAMARARDLDEVHQKGGGHLGANVVPSAFAISEYSKRIKGKAIHGKDFILAVAMGADLICRISLSSEPPCIFKGWNSETWGSMAVAVTAAKLLAFDQAKIHAAMGISYLRLSGNSQVYDEGPHAARLQNGFAGQGGVLSALMADQGITGPKEILEGKFGVFPLYLRGGYSAEFFRSGLGKRFEGANATLKRYPVVATAAPAIYACIELANKNNISAESVKKITISSSKFIIDSFGTEEKRYPKTSHDAQFSLYYGPAVGLLKKRLWLDDFTDEAIRRPEVLKLCQLIELVIDPKKDALKVLLPPTDIEIETKEGRKYDMRVEVMPGHPDNPLSWADVMDKFKDCVPWSARPFSEQEIAEISQCVQHLETLEDVTVILDHLK